MARYVVAPRAAMIDGWNNDVAVTASEVIEVEGGARPEHTGLVDHTGCPIMRLPDRVKIGFLP